ncbi:MAG: hypothetical protein WCK91_02650 [bacterium]
MKEYLPSKSFISRVIILAIFIALSFGVYKLSVFVFSKFSHKGIGALTAYPGGNIQKDTNNNGIPDWEESLWGLDPNSDGAKNKAIIEQKKGLMSTITSSDSAINKENLSEDDVASREFFAAVMSLQQSGNLTDASIQSVADAIGEKIVATPIDDIYKIDQLKTVPITKRSAIDYYAAITKIFVKYKDKSMGDELRFISQGLANKDPNAMRVAAGVADSYRSFGQDMIKIPVPDSLSKNHLEMANSYEKTAQSIEGMAKVLDEPIVGMRAFINYNKYSSTLANDINYLSDNLAI